MDTISEIIYSMEGINVTEQEQFIAKLREHYATPQGMYSLWDFQDNFILMDYIFQILSGRLEDVTPYTLKEINHKDHITLTIFKKRECEDD